MKKKKKADPLEKLVKLTKLLKQDKVAIEPTKTTPVRGPNKWRSYDPKFGPKPEKSENVVQAGGMDVDPALKDEYENWRKDKMAQQYSHRLQTHRKGLAAARERARDQTDQTPPAPSSDPTPTPPSPPDPETL